MPTLSPAIAPGFAISGVHRAHTTPAARSGREACQRPRNTTEATLNLEVNLSGDGVTIRIGDIHPIEANDAARIARDLARDLAAELSRDNGAEQ